MNKSYNNDKHNIGKYGLLKLNYLKKYKLGLYFDLIESGKLNEYIHNIDTSVMESMPKLIKKVSEENKNKELTINEINNIVDEIILEEFIYV